jgi:putative DNA primase/helicase
MSISKKYLSDSDRERICREICHIEKGPDKKGELFGLCPIHGESETTASLSFSYNIILDTYHCFSCGADGDLIKLYSEVNHLGQKDGFKSFCEKYNIPIGETYNHKKDDRPDAEISIDQIIALMREAWEKFPPLPEECVSRMVKERAWSDQCIKFLDLRLQTVRLDKKTGRLAQISKPVKIAIPIYNEHGSLVNIRLYEPGAKQFKIISFAQSTGDSRLFPAKPQDGPILLCEGESDTICALSHGFNAITQTSKLKNWTEEHLTHFKDKDVIIAYDADQAGQKYTRFAAESLTGKAKSVKVVQWPAFMGGDESGAVPKDHGQDLTDFLVRHKKTTADLQALIDSALPWQSYSISSSERNPGECVENTNDVLQYFNLGVNNRYSFKARHLAEGILADEKLLSDPETGLLYRWNGKVWEKFDEDHIRRDAIKRLGNEAQKSRVEDAVFQIKMLSTIEHGRSLNDKDDWICLNNGMLNLNSYEMTSHHPSYLCTYSLPVDFDPESKNICHRWLRYLETNIQTPEVIAQFQEFFGYCLTKDTRYQKALFGLGHGGDGKSTAYSILKEMIGDENCAAVSFADLENEFHRSSLYHKLINISTEIGAQSIESPYFKAITGGDVINAAFKHKNAFAFKPYCKLVVAGNSLPRVRDNSDGYFRRFLPIQFKRQFLEGDPERDPYLFEALKEELSEIFYWSLCGLERLRKQKLFTTCDETKTLMMGYRRSNNPVLCFTEDECIFNEHASIDKKDLYNGYRKYCGEFGYAPLNYDNFIRELLSSINHLKLYRPTVNGERKNYIKGIEIRSFANVD